MLKSCLKGIAIALWAHYKSARSSLSFPLTPNKRRPNMHLKPQFVWLFLALAHCTNSQPEVDASHLADDDTPTAWSMRHVSPTDVRFSPDGDVKAAVLAGLQTTDTSLDIAMYSQPLGGVFCHRGLHCLQ